MKRILIAGTADTKAAELIILRDAVAAAGAVPVVVDVGTRAHPIDVDVPAATVGHAHPAGLDAVLGGSDRGTSVSAMTEAFRRWIATAPAFDAVIGIGGSGGTAIVTAGMRALPIGLPKIMVSTLASGDVSSYVDVSDIVMMPSITDLGEPNDITRRILGNAAAAAVAMANTPPPPRASRAAIGLTMFGVTTPAVTRIAEQLRAGHDCLVFHATGTGGRAMEKLAASFMLAGIVDVTTTEIADLLFGGVLPAAPDRLDVVARTRLPYVGSVGALDMINFRARSTLPAAFAARRIHQHDPNVTLVRTTADECRAIGAWIGAKLARCDGPVRVLLPERGISALDIEGGPFFDPEADAALFDAIERTVAPSDSRRLLRLPCHINDPAFADAVVAEWRAITNDVAEWRAITNDVAERRAITKERD